ncbi:MAG: hypothetical protein ABIA12_01945 [Candidatus Aenigmatarchaeota archaeon]
MALVPDVLDSRAMQLMKEASLYHISFRPKELGGKVRQYVGWAERRDDILNVCVLSEYFIDGKNIEPEINERLESLEFRSTHRLYRVDADGLVLVHGVFPAKV